MTTGPKLNRVRCPSHRDVRGIPLGDGKYTGCLYGYGDLTPLTGPCDCPVCNGSGFEGVIGTTLPHSDFGDPDCCGCLNGVMRGDEADIVCNECDAVVRTVPAAELQQTLTEMGLTLDVCTEQCQHCGAANVFPGFSVMMAFTCQQCGKVVRLSDDPHTEHFFGTDEV
jgi:hypothetical protein